VTSNKALCICGHERGLHATHLPLGPCAVKGCRGCLGTSMSFRRCRSCLMIGVGVIAELIAEGKA